jgi:hypothetical protein
VSSANKQRYSFPPSQDGLPAGSIASPQMAHKEWADDDERELPELHMQQPVLRPNRRRGEDVEMGGFSGLTEGNMSQHNLRGKTGNLNPLVHNFRSPIGMSLRCPSIILHPTDANANDLRSLP